MVDKKNNNNLIIRAHGLGFIFMFFIEFIMLVVGLISVVTCFLWFNKEMDLVSSIVLLIIILLGIPWLFFELINLFKKAKVEFVGQKIITYGQNSKYFPEINTNCENFFKYKLTSKFAAQCIEFTLKDNKKILFHTMQFSKKQVLSILNEIKTRGGFLNQEIELNRYYL